MNPSAIELFEDKFIRLIKEKSSIVWIKTYDKESIYNLLEKLCSEKGIKIYYFADIDCEYFEKIYCNEDLMIKEICIQK